MNKDISEVIREELHSKHKRFYANDNISEVLTDERRQLLIEELTGKFTSVLKSLVIDTDNDPNSKETGKRLAKMYVNEIMRGRFYPDPRVASFPNEKQDLDIEDDEDRAPYSYDGLLVVPAELTSVCSHHHQIVRAKAYIGIIPGKNVIGLSKYARIAQHLASRGTLQEQLTRDILKAIQESSQTDDVGVFIKGTHGCMTNRGIKLHSGYSSTAELGGRFFSNPKLREEFYTHINLLEHTKE